jgi:hypothetical protein
MIKKVYLMGLISLLVISCSKEAVSTDSKSSLTEEIKALDFESHEIMDSKIDEINALKAQKELSVLKEYENFNKNQLALPENLSVSEIGRIKKDIITKSLTIYHAEKLKSIYAVRNELNFTSIQSIADEINSLSLINSSKATNLFKQYKKFLKKTKFEVQTIFDDRIANVINVNGEVLVKGKKLDFNNSNSANARYIRDEDVLDKYADYSIKEGYYYYVRYYAGREYHKNSIGVGFYKNYTELKAYISVSGSDGIYQCPTTFSINPGSKAGFVYTGSGLSVLCEYSITLEYPSGYGVSVRNTGGNRNCKFSPTVSGVGGFFKGTCTANWPGFTNTLNLDIKYFY